MRDMSVWSGLPMNVHGLLREGVLQRRRLTPAGEGRGTFRRMGPERRRGPVSSAKRERPPWRYGSRRSGDRALARTQKPMASRDMPVSKRRGTAPGYASRTPWLEAIREVPSAWLEDEAKHSPSPHSLLAAWKGERGVPAHVMLCCGGGFVSTIRS
jgi:hypothetical protein